EETRTAARVAELLESFGIAVERGVAKTGVIGTLKGSAPGARAIALRADMDALHVHEKNGFGHASRNQGRMHACGHDGHTTMLLGAARGSWSRKGCWPGTRSRRSLGCITGRGCRPGNSRSARGR